MVNVRQYTNALLAKAECGEIDWETIARECLSEMSEYAVEDMCRTTEWVSEDDLED